MEEAPSCFNQSRSLHLSHIRGLTDGSAGKKRFGSCWYQGLEKFWEASEFTIDGAPVAPEWVNEWFCIPRGGAW